jgi:hypothetical protein
MSRIVDPSDGAMLPCVWPECDRLGDTRYERVTHQLVPAHWETTHTGLVYLAAHWVHRHYPFCSDRHRLLWINSPISHENLPTGSRGMIT